MTETIEPTESKKGIIRRAYEDFKSTNTTYKATWGAFILGTGIAFGSVVGVTTREGTPELRNHNHLVNELYSLKNTSFKFQDLLNEKYVDFLRTSVRSIEARKDSLESLPSFKIAKEESKKSGDLWSYIAMGGIAIMGGSLVTDLAMRKRKKKTR